MLVHKLPNLLKNGTRIMKSKAVFAVVLLTIVIGLLLASRIAVMSAIVDCGRLAPNNTIYKTKVINYTSLLPTSCSAESILCGLGRDSAPLDALLNSMSVDILKKQFHQHMTEGKRSTVNSSVCTERKRFGQDGDGGYEICMSSPFRPTSGQCLVYSFGISGDWTFDTAVSKYGCEIHSFDPSIGLQDHIHPPGIHFHNLGLWGRDMTTNSKWALAKLSTIRRKLGHENRVIDYLKIDVEAAEWPFLRNIVDEEPEQVASIRQLALETHTPWRNPRKLTVEDLAEMIHYMSRLDDLGLTVVHTIQHNWCCATFSPLMPPGVPDKCCYETFYVNTRLRAPST